MNENKIDFIVCYNDEKYVDMCTSFLSKLFVPDGYEIDVIGVSDVDDIAKAYNELMNTSDAKYKVYLFANVFLTDTMFLIKMLSQFQMNTKLGMLGCVGTTNDISTLDSGIVWNIGRTCIEDGIDTTQFIGCSEGKINALNGFILATQVDIPWRDCANDNPDLFDICHSIDMRNRGYCLDIFDVNSSCCHYYPLFSKYEHIGTYKIEKGTFSTNLPSNQMPLVSCILPTYNAEPFLRDTLNSVLRQSYKNIEIIVVDDASQDNTKDIILEYANYDNRIIPAFHEKNYNVCVGCNEAYSKARGKYLAPIGHDDLWMADKIARQVSLLERHPQIGVCLSTCKIIGDNLEVVEDERCEMHDLFNQPNRRNDEWIDLLFFNYNALCSPSALIRNEVLDGKFYLYTSLQMQDYDLWLRLLAKTEFYIIHDELTLYRQFSGKSNLSALSYSSCNRMMHEDQYIKYHFLQSIDDSTFVHLFKKHFRCDDSSTEMELKCEKALILYSIRNVNCINMFMELFDNDECRKLLENKYHLSLKEFYKINNEVITYNYSTQATIKYYEKEVAELKDKVEKLLSNF